MENDKLVKQNDAQQKATSNEDQIVEADSATTGAVATFLEPPASGAEAANKLSRMVQRQQRQDYITSLTSNRGIAAIHRLVQTPPTPTASTGTLEALVPSPAPSQIPGWVQAAIRAVQPFWNGTLEFIGEAAGAIRTGIVFTLEGIGTVEIAIVGGAIVLVQAATTQPTANDDAAIAEARLRQAQASANKKKKQGNQSNNSTNTHSQTSSQNQSRPGTATEEEPEEFHRGTIQVQGNDMGNFDQKMLSVSWARPKTPYTKAEGLAGLAHMKSQLSANQLKNRTDAFKKAEKFIQNTLYQAPPQITRTFQNNNLPDKTIRVDIEIRTGKAFV